MTSAFLSKLIVENDNGATMTLAQPLVYWSALFNAEMIVPAGFVTDFASIPRLLHTIIPKHGKYDAPAVLHDAAYQTGHIGDRSITQLDADRLMLEAMQVKGVRWTQRRAIYLGCRMGGWLVWRRYRRTPVPPVPTTGTPQPAPELAS
jgi:hypothetical protein